jgi:O-antigen ligase
MQKYKNKIILNPTFMIDKSVTIFLSSFLIGIGIVEYGLSFLYLSFGLLAFLLVFLNPYAGICMLSFFIPLENFIKQTALLSGMKFLGFLVLFSVMIFISLQKEIISVIKKKHIYQPLSIYILFIFWNILSLIWAKDHVVCYVKLQTQASLFIYYTIFIMIATHYKKTTFVNYFILGSIISVLSLFINLGTNDFSQFMRFTGGGLDKNEFAVIISISLCISLMMFQVSSKLNYRILLLIYFPISILSVTYTKSRTGFLCLIIFLIHYFISLKSSSNKYKLFGTFYVLLICITVINLVPEGFFERVTNFSLTYDLNLGRKELWQTGFKIFLENPALGIGTNNFKYYDIRFFKTISEPTVAHNAFISVVAELGIIGLCLFCTLVFYYLRILVKNILYLKKLKKTTKNDIRLKIFYGLFFAFSCYLIGSLTLTWEYVKIFPFLLGTITIFEDIYGGCSQ